MAFDDLEDEEGEEESSPGDEALDDLAGTLSGDQSPDSDTTTEKTSEENNSEYDLQNDPAFPTAKAQTQHSVYCLPDTWDTIDGSSGLLFEAEIKLRRSGYGSVQKRELHNALLLAAAKQLTVEDIFEAFIETRENRKSGELIDTKQ